MIRLIGGLKKICRRIRGKRFLIKTTPQRRARWGKWLKMVKRMLAYVRDVARLDTSLKPASSQFNAQDAKRKVMWPELVLRSYPGSV
jgi:hypothetical protein